MSIANILNKANSAKSHAASQDAYYVSVAATEFAEYDADQALAFATRAVESYFGQSLYRTDRAKMIGAYNALVQYGLIQPPVTDG